MKVAGSEHQARPRKGARFLFASPPPSPSCRPRHVPPLCSHLGQLPVAIQLGRRVGWPGRALLLGAQPLHFGVSGRAPPRIGVRRGRPFFFSLSSRLTPFSARASPAAPHPSSLGNRTCQPPPPLPPLQRGASAARTPPSHLSPLSLSTWRLAKSAARFSPPLLLVMARRGVWQLQKLTVSYCEHSGSSAGARCVVLKEKGGGGACFLLLLSLSPLDLTPLSLPT